MRYLVWLTAIAAATTLLSCSQQPEYSATDASGTPGQTVKAVTPEQVAQAFMDAGNSGEEEAFKAHLTAAARKGLDSGSGMNVNANQYESYEIGTATITGDDASVPVDAVKEGQDQKMSLKMRQEDGAWRIFAIGASMGDGMEMTINLEEIGGMLESMVEGFGEAMGEGLKTAFEDAARGGNEEERAKRRASFEALHALDDSEYEASWMNTTDYRSRTAREALDDLASKLGLVVHAGENSDALDAEVKSDVSGKSRLEAIETICNDLGLHTVFPDVDQELGAMLTAMAEALAEGITRAFDSAALDIPDSAGEGEEPAEEEEAPSNAITIAKGARPYPIAFAGPFLVEVGGVEENAPHATGSVNLVTKAYGIDQGMLALLDEIGETVRIARVRDAKDRSLLENEDTSYFGGNASAGTATQDQTNVSLKNLLREVEAIETIEGSRMLVLPTEVQTVEFTTLRESVSKSVGDIRVTIKKVDKSTEFEVTGPEGSVENVLVKYLATDADGKDLGILFESTYSWKAGLTQTSVQTDEVPAAVEMKIVTGRKSLEYAFVIKNTPLMKFAQMPEKIEPLSFAGSVPVEVSFVAFGDRSDPDFPKVTVKTTSHANKEATSIQAKFIYFDGSGAELKDFPHTLTGPYRDGDFQPAAPVGGGEEIETTAFFMPENTQDIRVEVTRVEFVDGTVWE